MPRWRPARVMAVLLLLAASAWTAAGPAAAEERQRQVLVFYATRRDAQVATVGERDLPRLLENGLDGHIDYYSEFVDPARFTNPAYHAALATFLRKKYENHRFDILIAVGDDALTFVDANRGVFLGAPPVLFYGTTRDIRRPANSTGVVGERDLRGTIELARALDPALRHVFVVAGADANDRAFARLAESQFRTIGPELDFTYWSGLATRDLEARLRTLPARSMVFYLVVDQDGDGQFFHPLQYLDRVAAAANAPTYSWVDSAIGHGVVGGSLKSQEEQIRAVAERALRVLRGEAADAIPVARLNLNVWQVDWRQLRRWGLNEAGLPPGTLVLFREPSAWERYRSYIIATLILLVAQSGLIAGLLLQRRHRRKAEEQLLDSQAQLRASYDRIRDLGARLLHAQEGERAYIARELHDDVSQQLALIEMDLKLLGGGEPADSTVARETLGRVQSVAQSVRELSHRLHPAKLRLIGLVVALKGLQRETSQPGLKVEFTHEDVPSALPPDLTVCLFRVAQEALQNAAKYSGARTVHVRLAMSGNDLTLTIEDDGVGFNIPEQWGKGLGLVSMMERIEAIGGDLKIRSAPGAGTRLDAVVPIESERAGSVAV